MMPNLTGYETYWRKSLAIWKISHSGMTPINRDEMLSKYIVGPKGIKKALNAVDQAIKPFLSTSDALNNLYDICSAIDQFITGYERTHVLTIARIVGEHGIRTAEDLRTYSGNFESWLGIGESRAEILVKARNFLQATWATQNREVNVHIRLKQSTLDALDVAARSLNVSRSSYIEGLLGPKK